MSRKTRNFLQETIEKLQKHGKSPGDVIWVGSRSGNYTVTWEQFTQMADIEYEFGYGRQYVADDLVVVGKGWWLERWTYDGFEGWQYRTPPVQNTDAQPLNGIMQGEEGIDGNDGSC